jgi:hypothetical protein
LGGAQVGVYDSGDVKQQGHECTGTMSCSVMKDGVPNTIDKAQGAAQKLLRLHHLSKSCSKSSCNITKCQFVIKVMSFTPTIKGKLISKEPSGFFPQLLTDVGLRLRFFFAV